MNPYYVVFLPLINIVLDCISKKHHKLKLIAKMAIMKLLVNAVLFECSVSSERKFSVIGWFCLAEFACIRAGKYIVLF